MAAPRRFRGAPDSPGLPRAAPRRPKSAPRRPKIAPRRLKIARTRPRRAQDGPRARQDAPTGSQEPSRDRSKRPKSLIFIVFFDVFGLFTIPCFQRSKTAEEPRAPQEAPGYPQDDTKNRREPSHQTARLFQGDFWLTAPAKQLKNKGFPRIPFFFKVAPCLHSHDSPQIKPPSPPRKDATKPSMATHQRKRKGN